MPEVQYRWDEWLDGRLHLLLRHKDFFCPSQRMAAKARRAAEKRGLRILWTNVWGKGVQIRAVTEEEYWQEKGWLQQLKRRANDRAEEDGRSATTQGATDEAEDGACR